MILSNLYQYSQVLRRTGKLPPIGWFYSNVYFALELDDNGQIIDLIDLRNEKGYPQTMDLPYRVIRSVNINPNYLADPLEYCAGIDTKTGTPNAKSRAKFESAKNLHLCMLPDDPDPSVQALRRYFSTWDPDCAAAHPVFAAKLPDKAIGNFVFLHHGRYLHEVPAAKAAWDMEYQRALIVDPDNNEDCTMTCLVTGQPDVKIAQLHRKIANLAPGNNIPLVSINISSGESYGLSQSYNAPVSVLAADGYVDALTYLADYKNKHRYKLGDAVLCYWSASDNDGYAPMFSAFTFGETSTYTNSDLSKIAKELCQGRPVEFDNAKIDPDMPFYTLTLIPGTGRITIQSFYQQQFGQLLDAVQQHYDRLQISYGNKIQPSLTPQAIVAQTQRPETKTVSNPLMLPRLMTAILHNQPYPAELIQQLHIRIRAEVKDSLSWQRAAIIKAYYLRNANPYVPKEILTMTLNRDSSYPPYLMGRLFAVLEDIQREKKQDINASIKDRYFNAACTTPVTVFPRLMTLAQTHLAKLDEKNAEKFETELRTIMTKMTDVYPARLNMAEQSAFILGYYHQCDYNRNI